MRHATLFSLLPRLSRLEWAFAVVLWAAPGLPLAQVPAARADAGAMAHLNRNVYAAGGQVRPAAPVAGDFAAVGGRVILDKPVAGDASLAGGSVDVRAPVGDDVRAAGGDISIESTVGGELFASGGNIALTPEAVIGRTARMYGGSITIEGRIDGALKARAQRLVINGEVRGDADLSAGQIELGPNARIGGVLNYGSESVLKRADSAVVAGAVTRAEGAKPPGFPPRERAGRSWRSTAQGWVAGLFSYLALLACAAVFVLLVPVFGTHAAERVKDSPGVALGIGFATLLAVPVFAVLLCITLLGIPLGIAVMMLFPVLLLAGFTVGVLWVSRLIPDALGKPWPASWGGGMAYVAAALLLLLLLGRVPFVGGLALSLLTLAGVGACVLEMYGRRKGPGTGASQHRPRAELSPEPTVRFM